VYFRCNRNRDGICAARSNTSFVPLSRRSIPDRGKRPDRSGSWARSDRSYGFIRTLSKYASMDANGRGVVVQCATCRAMSMALKAKDGGELSETV
jgi:hypothetical protein